MLFFFYFGIYSLDFYFFLDFFVKVLLVFNFIIQLSFMLFYFFFNLTSFFWFVFSFVKVIFCFNLTLQLKILVCPLIYFLFWFSPNYFNYNFLDPFIQIDFFFFSISSFNIRLLALEFHDLYSGLVKLAWVNLGCFSL